MAYIFLFVIGICLGSFINCLVYRLNHNLSLWGWSFCPKCKEKVCWYDNVPLLSFFLLRGKCRRCHSLISWQYPVVELIAGALALLIFQFSNLPIYKLIFNLLITYCFLAIFVSDLRYMIIPDKVLIFAGLISLIFLISLYPNILISHLLSAGGVASFFLFLVLITRGKGMGMGDVKLAGLMGLILGWPQIVAALFLAFLTGAMVGVILILLGKKKFGQHIPFGPFLTASTFVILLWGEKIWHQVVVALLWLR